jgi:hypothetical protein
MLAQSQEELKIQRAGYLPVFSLLGSYGYTSEVAELQLESPIPGLTLPRIQAGTRDRYDAAVSIDVPVFTGFRIRNQVRAAEMQVQAQNARQEASRSQILLLVGALYFQTQENELQQRVLEQAVERAGSHLDRTRGFFLAKKATAFDTLPRSPTESSTGNQLQRLAGLHDVLTSKLAHAVNVTFAPRVAHGGETVGLSLGGLDEYVEQALRKGPTQEKRPPGEGTALGPAPSGRPVPPALRERFLPLSRPGELFEDEWMDYYTVGLNVRWRVWNWLQDRRQVKKALLDRERLGLPDGATPGWTSDSG